jgi:hypothetical protein
MKPSSISGEPSSTERSDDQWQPAVGEPPACGVGRGGAWVTADAILLGPSSCRGGIRLARRLRARYEPSRVDCLSVRKPAAPRSDNEPDPAGGGTPKAQPPGGLGRFDLASYRGSPTSRPASATPASDAWRPDLISPPPSCWLAQSRSRHTRARSTSPLALPSRAEIGTVGRCPAP